jgi:gluconokinase
MVEKLCPLLKESMGNSNNPVQLIAVDIGTTHVKAILYRDKSGIIGQESQTYDTYYPQPDFVEQDPEEIFSAVLIVIKRLIDNTRIPSDSIAALVFAGIAQSLIPVDKQGNALSRAFNWADKRSLKQNSFLKTILDSEDVKQRTGCTLHPMYLLSRLAWIKEETPEIFAKTERFISIKEYVLERLFGVKQVDYSIASCSGIWNMHIKNWDQDLLSEINVPVNRFSECVETTTLLSNGLRQPYASQIGLQEGTPGVIGAFDGGLAHLGSLGMNRTKMSLTVGTGAALRRGITSPQTIPGSEAWCYYLTEDHWLLGGVLHDAGNVMKWFVDRFMFNIENKKDAFLQLDTLAEGTSPGADGLFFIPHLGGERCPHYFPDSKGFIYGLTFSHGLNHMVRAMMEGLTYNLYSVYRMLAPDLQPELVVTGGILNSPVWLKIVANFFQRTLWLPEIRETTAWGGIMLGLKAIGIVKSMDEFDGFLRISGKQEPEKETFQVYQNLLHGYDQLYTKIYGLEITK